MLFLSLKFYRALPVCIAIILFFILCSFPALAGVSLQVKVIGLKDPLEKNVLYYLDILKKKDDDNLSTRWIKRLHEKAPLQIREALRPYGYYTPVIKSRLNEIDGRWLAEYSIDPGKPVTIRTSNMHWEGAGADKPVFQQSLKDCYGRVGDQLIHSKYEAVKNKLLNLAYSQGYPKATITKSEVLVDLEENSAKITLLINTGPLYFFGAVLFEQNFLDQDLLNHYVTIKSGDPYSLDALIDFQQNLLTSNYAREVTLNPLFDQTTDRKVPLKVIMQPVLPHKLSFALGYETDIGLRASARWTDRLINRRGHHSDVYLKLSEKERALRGEYSVPVVNPLTDSWVSSADYTYEKTPTTESSTVELETAFVRRNLEDTFFYKGFASESIERFSIGNDPEETTTLLIFGGIARFAEMEETMFPKNGYYVSGDLRGSAEALVSDTSFTRLYLKGRYLAGLGENGRIDARLETGGAWVDNFDIYPTSLRFFAGGDNSIRGYTYQSIGPTNADGVVEGGRHLLTSSVEYDYRVAEKWVVSGFVDAGNAYNDTIDSLYVGAGGGVRWLAPFGSLRLDLAWPVSQQPKLNDIVFHVGFGATL